MTPSPEEWITGPDGQKVVEAMVSYAWDSWHSPPRNPPHQSARDVSLREAMKVDSTAQLLAALRVTTSVTCPRCESEGVTVLDDGCTWCGGTGMVTRPLLRIETP